jgi:hypothetical protein
MTVGIRVRDPVTGALRLDLTDYTVKIVHSALLSITSNGQLAVPGADPGKHAAVLMPQIVMDWQTVRSNRSAPRAPIVQISNGLVSWIIPGGYIPMSWQLLVVKFT